MPCYPQLPLTAPHHAKPASTAAGRASLCQDDLHCHRSHLFPLCRPPLPPAAPPCAVPASDNSSIRCRAGQMQPSTMPVPALRFPPSTPRPGPAPGATTERALHIATITKRTTSGRRCQHEAPQPPPAATPPNPDADLAVSSATASTPSRHRHYHLSPRPRHLASPPAASSPNPTERHAAGRSPPPRADAPLPEHGEKISPATAVFAAGTAARVAIRRRSIYGGGDGLRRGRRRPPESLAHGGGAT
uniref:Uncharacterized protein n=1 Tax=Oryza rufipogon TaxID=4529 RepID=A0A0E0RHI1_ORYRU